MKRILPLIILLSVAVVSCHKKYSPNPPPLTTPQGEKSFLSIPFSRGTDFQVAQGWVYSKREQSIYHKREHYAVDFSAARGTRVLAATDGSALASYQGELNGIYKGRKVGYGLGLFVQVWHPEFRMFTIYGHLSGVAEGIPYYKPERHKENFEPTLVRIPGDQIQSLVTKSVHRGELIGYVGDSGCSWGYQETPEHRPDPRRFPSLDGPNLHFSVLQRDSNGKITACYDPYGIYGAASSYNNHYFSGLSLWLVSSDGQPLFANEQLPRG